MEKYILHITGGSGYKRYESFIPFESENVDKFESDILESKDDKNTYHLVRDEENVYFDQYEVYTLGEWFVRNSPDKLGKNIFKR